jgi:signal transduction histidine kinase
MQAAEGLLGPARITTITASAASVILLLLGVLMHRAARRAQRAEEELRRREALSALGEMAAVLAHEIRTPLGSIKGNAQLIGEGAPDDDRVTAMVREAGRLERLVNGLLDYARPQAPRRQAGIDPDLVTTRAAEIVAPKAAAASVNVVTDLVGAGSCLEADPDQLLQVLVNLLQNAVEACADSSACGDNVVVRVRAGRGAVTFTVLDQGPGLSRDLEVQELMRPFFSTKEKGTGLGLSVAMQIARQHGGELTLRDRKEGGAEARLVLPKRGEA